MLIRLSAVLVLLLLVLGTSSCGGPPPMPEPEEACTASEKRCDGECVSRSDPLTGCGRNSCNPCNQYDSVTHVGEVFTCSADDACELVDCNSSGGMRADCDQNLFNGCEIDLGSDLNNCGACGNSCPRTVQAGASATSCWSGECKAQCLPGRVDTDGLLENGCEGTQQFAVGEGCGGTVVDGAPCNYLAGGCDFFTPGSPCVTSAVCNFFTIGDSNWSINEETCFGRPQGAFCELDVECYSGGCAEHECLAAIGSSCQTDGQCGSGACCPAEVENTFECATACLLISVGAACTWDAQCRTGNCAGTTCGPCLTEDCTSAICGTKECGFVSDVACGTCTGTDYCNGGGMCEAACLGLECGLSHGVDCGTCSGTNVCVAGLCEDACEGLECGLSQGVSCGACTGTDYCNAGVCEDACADLECGSNEGVDCGDCSGTDYCNDGACEDACAEIECGSNEGVDCGGCQLDQVCAGGSCVPLVCPVDQDFYCKDGDVYACAGGASEELEDACGDTEFCTENDATCNPLCTPTEDACINGVHGTCASDEMSLEPGAEDCFAQSLSCYGPLGCGQAYEDNDGSSLCIDSYNFVGNVFEVEGNSFLRTFGMLVDVAAPTDVTFSVYTGSSTTGPFTLSAANTREIAAGEWIAFSTAFDLPFSDGDFVLLAVSTATEDAIACHGLSSSTDTGFFARSTGQGYLLAANPGATVATAPMAVTSWTIINSYVP